MRRSIRALRARAPSGARVEGRVCLRLRRSLSAGSRGRVCACAYTLCVGDSPSVFPCSDHLGLTLQVPARLPLPLSSPVPPSGTRRSTLAMCPPEPECPRPSPCHTEPESPAILFVPPFPRRDFRRSRAFARLCHHSLVWAGSMFSESGDGSGHSRPRRSAPAGPRDKLGTRGEE